MKILLLPGLDGTGTLFQPLIQQLSPLDCTIVALPSKGSQDYHSQLAHLQGHLPDEDFILIAESFSGPTAALLAADPPPHLKAIVFVATFLKEPNPILTRAAIAIPVPTLLNFPGARSFLEFRFLRQSEQGIGADQLHQTLKSLNPIVIHDRLTALIQIPKFDFKTKIPALYLKAGSDTIVLGNREHEFRAHFEDLSVQKINATHLLLQTKPVLCGKLIRDFIHQIRQGTSNAAE